MLRAAVRPALLTRLATPVAVRTIVSSAMGSSAVSYPRPVVFQPTSPGPASSSLIMIHGLGDSAAGWADIAQMLGPDLPHTRFVLPTAPVRPITLNGGMEMTGWYDIRALDKLKSETEDAAAMRESQRYIESLVEAEVAAGVPSHKVVVGGFSQGGAMALMMLRSQHKLAGVIGLSCYLLLHEEAPVVSEANKGTPVLMCHGDCDQVVQYQFGQRSYEQLKGEGAPVEFKTFEYMGHEACQEEFLLMRDFLRSCFADSKA